MAAARGAASPQRVRKETNSTDLGPSGTQPSSERSPHKSLITARTKDWWTDERTGSAPTQRDIRSYFFPAGIEIIRPKPLPGKRWAAQGQLKGMKPPKHSDIDTGQDLTKAHFLESCYLA